MSEKYDLGSEFDDSNFKSCFARSVVVNSTYKHTKSMDFTTVKKEIPSELKKPSVSRPLNVDTQDDRVRKISRSSLDESRRSSLGSIHCTSRRTSMCPHRATEIPVENIVNQSKLETLQWQLKETEKSREMYRAVMQQVVAFLERAHHSLGLLGNKINTIQQVPRSKSEHQMGQSTLKTQEEKILESFSNKDDTLMAHSDMSWRRPKKPEIAPEEIPPEKLAQEAFRLLRTAQSLLNTREPDLAQVNNEPENDIEFLATIAKEFPQPPEQKSHRPTSFSISPKLILPEHEVKISTALNRKLSLQLNDNRRNSLISNKSNRTPDSARGSFAENEADLLSSTLNEFSKDITQKSKYKDSEKSNSPAAGSISSVEDESGFSSLNSFQDVGLPIVNSTILDEVSAKNALLRSMLHNSTPPPIENRRTKMEEIKFWQKPEQTVAHKRWHSNPVEETNSKTQFLEVLWV